MCVDFRALNKVTAHDNYPLPLIEDCIALSEKKIFATLDLRDGFFHVAVAPNTQKYTSFVVPQGQYRFRRMPFGLRNAPSEFQRFVSDYWLILYLVKRFVCMDDIARRGHHEFDLSHRRQWTTAHAGIIFLFPDVHPVVWPKKPDLISTRSLRKHSTI